MAQDPRVWSTPEVRKCIINIRMLLSTVSAESFIEQGKNFIFPGVNTMLHVRKVSMLHRLLDAVKVSSSLTLFIFIFAKPVVLFKQESTAYMCRPAISSF
jgi:hypothetical protein